jgi:hypothetical protein
MIPDKGDFGFICGDFWVAVAREGTILPGSRGQPMKRSQLPVRAIEDAVGQHRLRITCGEATVCDLPVEVIWGNHPSQSEPILGFKTAEPSLAATLTQYEGKKLEFVFERLRS